MSIICITFGLSYRSCDEIQHQSSPTIAHANGSVDANHHEGQELKFTSAKDDGV